MTQSHFLQFQFIIKNFTNKSFSIHSLCKQVNFDIPMIINITETIWTKITDSKMKLNLTRLSNLFFRSLPPRIVIKNLDIQYYFNKMFTNQLSSPFIITGDFNSDNSSWGSRTTDRRGKETYKAFNKDNKIILNSNKHTHINIANDQMSNIDLSLSNSSLSQRLEWNVHKNITKNY